MLELYEFVWTLRSSPRVVFNNFLLIDAKDRNKISSEQKRLFFAVTLCPFYLFANTPFKPRKNCKIFHIFDLIKFVNGKLDNPNKPIIIRDVV